MASQQDLQELLRLLTVGRVPIKDAMSRVKALQANNLKSIQQIAAAPLSAVESAIGVDAKAARTLHNACKARVKQLENSSSSNSQNPASASAAAAKRPGADHPSASNSAKRRKLSGSDGGLAGLDPVAPQEYEASLELPVDTDEDAIRRTVLVTNRAPLVLAFAVELLRHTMPEQPPSSRLSLAQAVVSANSRSKAAAIGLAPEKSAEQEGWGQGQPKVRVLGREVSVLKRGGYVWKGDDEDKDADAKEEQQQQPEQPTPVPESAASSVTEPGSSGVSPSAAPPSWSASQPTTLKQSTFVVRAVQLTQPAKCQALLQSLFADVPSLKTATHNAWAYRAKVPTNLFNATTIREDSFDDGETGAGAFLLKSLRELEAVDTLVVMTRWYGGVMLGPDRWTLMRKCLHEALAERGRLTGARGATLGGEAVWGLDLEAAKDKSGAAAARSHQAGVVGMPIHRPEAALAYLFKSFSARSDAPPPPEAEAKVTTTTTKAAAPRKTAKALEMEREENVARLLGAIRLLYESWAGHLGAAELDRRAWSWYTATRPEVEQGPAGWGAKGRLRLADILDLRRKE